MSSSDCSVELYETPKKQRKLQAKRLQKFKIEWKNKFAWLEKHDDPFKAKCTICAITFSIDKSGIGQIKQHSESKIHSSKLINTQQSSILKNFLRSSTAESNDSRQAAAAELALVYHTIKHNLSYNSADCGVRLNKLLYAESKNAKTIQLGRTKQAAIVENVLGPYALEQTVGDIRDKNAYFSLQIDASNRKNVKLFPIVIQYFDIKAGIQQKLLDFYENPDESADGMFEAVKDSLKRNNLSFDKVIGLSADNVNSNFGKNHSLFTNIEKIVPHLIKGNCHAHIVHNNVKYGMNFLKCDVENIILKIYSHFSVSASRREELKKFVAEVNGEWHEIKRHIGTRWLSLLPAVDHILMNWTPITNYFHKLDDKCPTQICQLLKLEDEISNIQVKAFLSMVSHVLNVFDKTIKRLEKNDTTVLDLYEIMENLKFELNQRKQDKFFGYETNKLLKCIRDQNLLLYEETENNFMLFLEKCLIYLEKWFDFTNENWLYHIKSFNFEKELKFEDVEKIVDILFLKTKLNIDMDVMYSEIISVNEIYSKIKNCEKFKNSSLVEKWQQMLISDSKEIFSNLNKIVSLLLSVPASSAYSERIFSLVNIKWRDERNRSHIDLIKYELIITCNLTFTCNEALSTFLQDSNLLKAAQSNTKYK